MNFKFFTIVVVLVGLGLSLVGCAEVSVPDARNVTIPSPVSAEQRREAVNERPDSVVYLPLGEDVLVPERMIGDDLPREVVGPFELRSETLAGALQLILADYDVSIAFETELGLDRKVTVANLKGPLNSVVSRVCSLADLYCSYEEGTLVVKETQTFTVSLPPLGDAEGGQEFIGDVITGLSAIIGSSGSTPVSDPTTRTIIYGATQRTSKLAENYFERLRANTAMIVFETYIWEVSLNSGNSTGVKWEKLKSFGKFNSNITFNGSIAADFTNPVSIGLPTTGAVDPTEVIEFLSQFGAVKTISQPQITVLSGSSAELRVADTENYVSEVSSTISGDNTTTSVSTDSVDSGFTLNIGSSWNKSTVYANVNINLTNVDEIEDFAFDTDGGGGQTTIQLPQTTERELKTQIRVRPGDSVLIAGLVRERDNFSSRGPGFMEPILPDSRTAKTDNLELVILLRPRVVAYTASNGIKKHKPAENKAQISLSQPMSAKPIEKSILPPASVKDEVFVVRKPSVVSSSVAVDNVPAVSVEPIVPEVNPYVDTPLPEEVASPVIPVVKNTLPKVTGVEPVVSEEVPLYDQVSKDVYSQDYVPHQNSGYVPGYVSGYQPVYESLERPNDVIQNNAVDHSMYSQEVVLEEVLPPQEPLYSPPSEPQSVYKSSPQAPLSADVYNKAQSLNVYEIYEQSNR